MSFVQNKPNLDNQGRRPDAIKSSSALPVSSTREYCQFIEDLKTRVSAARTAAARSVNRELILLYWDIGCGIVEKQQTLGWGDAVVEMVAADLRRGFPGMKGFSPRNVWDMRRLYEGYSAQDFLLQALGETRRNSASAILRQLVAELADAGIWPKSAPKLGSDGDTIPFLRQLVAEIPWGQNLLILNKLAEPAARLYYLRATAQFGWSRSVLLNQIKAGAYERAVTEKKTHNFPLALPGPLATFSSTTFSSRRWSPLTSRSARSSLSTRARWTST